MKRLLPIFLSATAYAQDAGVPDATPAMDAAPAPDVVDVDVDVNVDDPPPPPVSGLEGRILDAETNDPILSAGVRTVYGLTASATTNLDGRYVLPLPPGTYEIRVTSDVYQPRRLRVVIRRGMRRVDVKLRPDASAVEEVVVEARADRRTESASLQERRRSGTVQDVISAQEISRSPDSNAGDAVKRVVSATVVGGRYVFIRGLGGRYSQTLLNGVTLPSPEPDQAAVPLDLFPAGMLANLTVVKTYQPDLPGAFSGGALMLSTNSYPSAFELKLRAASGWDSSSAFSEMYTYRGGDYDWIGVDSGRRALPESAPDDRPLRSGEPGIDDGVVERIAEDFPTIWNLHQRPTRPGFALSATAGDSGHLGAKKVGWLATAGYGHKDVIQRADVTAVRLVGGMLEERERLSSVSGTEQATLGTLLNAGFEPADGHAVDLFLLYTRSMDDRAHLVTGYSESDGQDIEGRRLQFVTRALAFGQVTGRHRMSSALELGWQGNLAHTGRDEPDTRDLKFDVLEDGRRRFDASPGSGERFFAQLEDVSGGASTTLTVRLANEASLKLGGLGQRSERTFQARRFGYSMVSDDVSVVFLDPEVMFSPMHIGPDFTMEERTLQADSYDASMSLGAGFLMGDVQLVGPLRLIGGARVEASRQELTPGSPFAITDTPEPGVDRSDLHVLPAANAVVALSEAVNVRAGYSWTVARPQFRELAPFLYYDFSRRRSVTGNPELRDTRIHNGDLRLEWFPGEREVLAGSVFYKRFVDPIEHVIVSAQGDVGYDNADGADAVGAEIEARLELGRLGRALRELRAAANLTLIRSRIELGEKASIQTSPSRPMQGQSPYVVNLDLGWGRKAWGTEVDLLYNVSGARIAEVGIEGLPDIYEEPFHRVDLTASQKLSGGYRLKLSGTNLLAQSIAFEQGPFTVYRYQPGVTALVSLEWSPN